MAPRRAASFVVSVVARAIFRVTALLHAAALTAQLLLEDSAHLLGFEALVAALITLALLEQNLPALACAAAAGVGLLCKQRVTTLLPRVLAPLLALALLISYALLAGRLLRTQAADGNAAANAVHAWLGLRPTPVTVALLAATAALAAAQVHTAAWRTATGCSSEYAAVPAPHSSTADLEPQVAAARHRVFHLIAALNSSPSAQHVVVHGSAAHLATGEAASAAVPAAVLLTGAPRWALRRSVSVHGRASWGWPDHLHFWACRFSLDALMIFVVALCCVQRDLIHAAYLALTLLLFRRREELRLRGNGLFVWMPLANVCVVAAMLLYQTPVVAMRSLAMHGGAAVLPAQDGAGGDDEACILAHLLGLRVITPPGSLAALKPAPGGAGLSLLMWLAVQVCSVVSRKPAGVCACTSG